MIRTLLLLFAVALIMSGCHKKVVTRDDRAYLLSWKNDTNLILLQDYKFGPGHPGGQEGSMIKLNGEGLMRVWATLGKSGPYIAYADTVFEPIGIAYKLEELPKFLSQSPYTHFPRFAAPQHNMVSDGIYNDVSIEDVDAGYVYLQTDHPLTVHLSTGHIERLNIIGIGTHAQPLTLHQPLGDSLHQGQILIRGREIETIALGQHVDKLTLEDCTVTRSYANLLNNSQLDTLVLNHVQFENKEARLALTGLASPASKHHVKLICKATDIAKLVLDYRFFDYCPLTDQGGSDQNTAYSVDKKFYSDMLSNQKAVYNEGGKTKALIDAAKYEDQLTQFGWALIPLKTWWNGYGYESGKIVWAALELFFVIMLINRLFMTQMFEAYTFKEIKTAYTTAENSPNLLKRSAVKLFLSAVYTGFLFFGLKLELDKLKLAHRGTAIWVIAQYITGIVAMAYIANLVLGK